MNGLIVFMYSPFFDWIAHKGFSLHLNAWDKDKLNKCSAVTPVALQLTNLRQWPPTAPFQNPQDIQSIFNFPFDSEILSNSHKLSINVLLFTIFPSQPHCLFSFPGNISQFIYICIWSLMLIINHLTHRPWKSIISRRYNHFCFLVQWMYF